MFNNLKIKVTNRIRRWQVMRDPVVQMGLYKTKEGYVILINTKTGEVEFMDPETGAIVSV